MAKATKTRPAAKSSKTRPGPARKRSRLVTRVSNRTKPRANTKQASAIAMLRSTKGTSIAALMESTGWQQHSVRGFLAGVVRKRLGLELKSSKVNGSRLYRILGPTSAQSDSAAAAES